MSANDFLSGGFAPAPEGTDHFEIKSQYDLFIGGKWVKSKDRFATANPATDEVLSEVALAGEKRRQSVSECCSQSLRRRVGEDVGG